MTADDWPDRMIDQRREDKIRWLLTDSRRYMEQCRAERHVEAREEVEAELRRRLAARRDPRLCRPCGGTHPAPPSRWKRLLHWAGWWP